MCPCGRLLVVTSYVPLWKGFVGRQLCAILVLVVVGIMCLPVRGYV
jgi:hypothetical protein